MPNPLTARALDQPISGLRYFLFGVILAGLKFLLDSLVASWFGQHWAPIYYWVPALYGFVGASPELNTFYFSLALVALPFMLVGIWLTLRRLRTLKLPGIFVLLFFIPAINLMFFLALAVARPSIREKQQASLLERLCNYLPGNVLGSAIAGVLLGAGVALAGVIVGAEIFWSYGAGIFLGLPFAVGFVAASVLNSRKTSSLLKSYWAATVAVVASGLLFLVLGLEGLMCIAMAFPLAWPMALIGASLAFSLSLTADSSAPTAACLILALPLAMFGDSASRSDESLLAVTSTVAVKAAPETVWLHVVTFKEIPEPTELHFRAGIAYPVRAQISGSGPGATRRCEFSTGAFVEPITVWDEPRLLRFTVTEQPPVMHELSLYRDLMPPHVQKSFVDVDQGEFHLVPDGRGGTVLHGTTWYRIKFAPGWYWKLWSDNIIHSIHLRVLDHIKKTAEESAREEPEQLTHLH